MACMHPTVVLLLHARLILLHHIYTYRLLLRPVRPGASPYVRHPAYMCMRALPSFNCVCLSVSFAVLHALVASYRLDHHQ